VPHAAPLDESGDRRSDSPTVPQARAAWDLDHQIRNAAEKQIPIRTFQDWNEAKPGFLEADLVAHGGTQADGSYLYTLTLTDIATGWTECLPLLNRGESAVVAALKRAKPLASFSLLGIDTDNGGEFI